MAFQLDLKLLKAMAAGNFTNINYTAIQLLFKNSSSQNLSGDDQYGDNGLTEVLEFQYYTWGVTGSIVSVLGLVGNALSIIVLANRRMMSSTSCYLIALAIFDSLILISLVLFMALPIFYVAKQLLEDYYRFYPYMHPYAYPTALIAQTCSIYTTVAFTLERYIAVCRPLRAAKMCTVTRARKTIMIIMVSSVVYNVPRMLEYRVVERTDPETNVTSASYEHTALGADPTFRHVYFIYMHIVFMLAIPFTMLAVMNILLIRAVKRSQKTQGKVNNRMKRENSLTVMLISVIMVFLICQAPSIVDNIFLATLDDDMLMSSPFVKLTSVSNLMVVMNSAINFYLYCLFGRKFRRVFCRIFCLCYLQRTITYMNQESSAQGTSFHNPTRISTVRHTNPHGGLSIKNGALDSVKNAFKKGNSSKLQMSIYENGKMRTMCASNVNNGKYQIVEDQTQL